jgi:hypothetical protein
MRVYLTKKLKNPTIRVKNFIRNLVLILILKAIAIDAIIAPNHSAATTQRTTRKEFGAKCFNAPMGPAVQRKLIIRNRKNQNKTKQKQYT